MLGWSREAQVSLGNAAAVLQQTLGVHSNVADIGMLQRSEKRKERVKKNWNKRQQATQEADGMDLKAMVIKRQEEAVKDAIQTGHSLQNKASATAAGWTGMVPQGLAAKKSQRPFSWDGQ